jgi:FixJ family two-component response regulator
MQEEGIDLKHKPLIAVVDDDQSVREALENLISSLDSKSSCLLRLRSFLIQIRHCKRDCAVLDLCLPGISGLELQRKLAADGLRIPAIVITANGNEKHQAEAVETGAVAFLRKLL